LRLPPLAAASKDGQNPRHMAQLLELRPGGSMLLFDRWYPSQEFIAHTLLLAYL